MILCITAYNEGASSAPSGPLPAAAFEPVKELPDPLIPADESVRELSHPLIPADAGIQTLPNCTDFQWAKAGSPRPR